MKPKTTKCPVCSKKTVNVIAHIRKMAMGEIYSVYTTMPHHIPEMISEGLAPHQEYIENNSKPQFKYTEASQ